MLAGVAAISCLWPLFLLPVKVSMVSGAMYIFYSFRFCWHIWGVLFAALFSDDSRGRTSTYGVIAVADPDLLVGPFSASIKLCIDSLLQYH